MALTYLKKEERLTVELDVAYAGKNYIQPRLDWFDGQRDITTQDTFAPEGGGESDITGSWWSDGGDLAMPKADREPRIICRKGSATFTVDSANVNAVYLRIFLNPGFGTGTIYLNGAVPSTVSGLSNAIDTFDCSAEAHASSGNEYKDILLFSVADRSLITGNIVVKLEMDNLESGNHGYVPIAGYKTLRNADVAPADLFTVELDNWIVPAGSPQNQIGATLRNDDQDVMGDISATFPTGFKDAASITTDVGTKTAASVSSGGTVTMPAKIVFDWPAETREGTEDQDVTLVVKYPDPDGTDSLVATTTVAVDNPGLTYAPTSNWYQDTNNGELRAYSDLDGATIDFTSNGDTLDIRVQKDYGWGDFIVEADGVQVATGSCHDDTGGGFYEWLPTISGLGAGDHAIKITSSNGGVNKFIIFSAFKYIASQPATKLTETIRFRFNKKHVPPKHVDSVTFNNVGYDLAMTDNAEKDLAVPFDNTNLEGLEVSTRFPTYCVYYSNGKQDVLEKYDLVVVDPFAVSRKMVKELQDKGIIVLVYISYGEEDSTLANEFDSSSAHVPWKGNGKGPGGYADYYSKGGNWYEEVSACSNDRQRYENLKACAENRAEYWTTAGRCGVACTNDFREGYKTQRAGGACTAGHVKSTFWTRDATVACKNASCPDYTPMNSNCPLYNKADNAWGQDFSILTQNFPDENGIWASYFVDVTKQSEDDASMSAWEYRIRDYYLPMLFNGPQKHVVYRQVATRATATGQQLTVKISDYPIDDEEELILEVHDGAEAGRVLVNGSEYSYDNKLATFTITPPEGGWTIAEGTYIKATYYRKGLNADGVFMDTVDTVDVYPKQEYQDAFAKMINDMKASYPNRLFCSNRGFGILDDIIQSCEYVMFETFISEYDWENGTYHELTDPATVEWNNQVIDQLIRLRRDNEYDVLALNYCSNGSEDDALREKIAERCRDLGFISWSSTILLNDPLPNTTVSTPGSLVKTNAWRRIDAKNID